MPAGQIAAGPRILSPPSCVTELSAVFLDATHRGTGVKQRGNVELVLHCYLRNTFCFILYLSSIE